MVERGAAIKLHFLPSPPPQPLYPCKLTGSIPGTLLAKVGLTRPPTSTLWLRPCLCLPLLRPRRPSSMTKYLSSGELVELAVVQRAGTSGGGHRRSSRAAATSPRGSPGRPRPRRSGRRRAGKYDKRRQEEPATAAARRRNDGRRSRNRLASAVIM